MTDDPRFQPAKSAPDEAHRKYCYGELVSLVLRMADWWLARTTAALRLLILACTILLAATSPAKALDLDELTVVTLARDGLWGVATAGSQGQAMAAAIRDCQAMTAVPSDCGAQFTTTRGGWVIANLCGDHKIMVAAETLEAAERAALSQEIDFRRSYAPDLPPCMRVLIVDPRGGARLPPIAPSIQPSTAHVR